MINNRFWVGAGYRPCRICHRDGPLEIMPNLKLGYSYDYTTSDIRTYSSGTHEVMFDIIVSGRTSLSNACSTGM